MSALHSYEIHSVGAPDKTRGNIDEKEKTTGDKLHQTYNKNQ